MNKLKIQLADFIYQLTYMLYIFLLQVFSWTGESPPDPRHPLDSYYDPASGRLKVYNSEVKQNFIFNQDVWIKTNNLIMIITFFAGISFILISIAIHSND